MIKTIGITGGVGAGKSEVINYIKENYNCRMIKADNLAYDLESPGNVCYEPILELLGRDIINEDGFINKNKMAAKIFADKAVLSKVNAIIHPAVKEYILQTIDDERNLDEHDFFLLEAALLIEEGYGTILDELWYVRADEAVRRDRLKNTRGYSDEKIDSILSSQKSELEYTKACKVVIDNSGSLEQTFEQIDRILGSYLK